MQHQLTDFHNLDGVCLLRGTDWIFTCSLFHTKSHLYSRRSHRRHCTILKRDPAGWFRQKASDLYLEGTRFQSHPGLLSWRKTVAGISRHWVALSYCDLQVTVPLWVSFNDVVTCYLHIAAVKNERMDKRVRNVGEMIMKGKDKSTLRKTSHSFVSSITKGTNSVQDLSADSSQVTSCPRRHLKWDNTF